MRVSEVDERELERAALAVYARYALEIVEGLGFCPWAAKARREGHVKQAVVASATPTPADAVARIAAFEADPAIEIGLILFPRVAMARAPFDRWVAEVRLADEARGPVIFALAAFHPDAVADTGSAGKLLPFIRRTPDPVIQCVRRDVLERVRGQEASGTAFVDLDKLDLAQLLAPSKAAPTPIHERVGSANLETVLQLGAAAVTAKLDDILRERDERYAQLGVPSRRPR
jgi:hypothetical protein